MANMNLSNHFLIAMPTLADPNFFQTVTLVCVHNEDGAMGVIINRPLDLDLGTVFDQMNIANPDAEISAQCVFEGGPVHRDRGFIIHRPALEWDSTIRVSADLAISTSRDVLEAISNGSGPESNLVALGYAGWGSGQLESEMAANAWLSGPADESIIFDLPPDERWRRAVEQLGIDVNTMSHDVGHA